ncbi:MAG: hypothetical protein ACAI35_02370 [Candidatus Methylacidiphilales bacterium]
MNDTIESHETTTNCDIHEMLARRKEIAVIWSWEDVQMQRPDLTMDQAWEVLKRCERYHDACLGLSWEVIDIIAEEMFPEAE